MTSYSELLKCREWQSLRREQFAKANNTCKNCKKSINWDFGIEIGYFAHVLEEDEDEWGIPRFKYKIEKVKDPLILHLHHTYYVRDTLPWDYPDICFETLCEACHKEVHANKKILMYASHELGQSQHLTACERCSGTGYLQEFHYYLNGVCFLCDGAGFEELKTNRFYYQQEDNKVDNIDTSPPPIMSPDLGDDDLPFSSDNKDWDLDGDDLPF
ncbi:MAG: hypothetical protein ACK5HD_01900 [Bacteroidota bacterium]|jgi:hypothetical protein